MICLGILWNGMGNYVKDVINDISSYGKVLDSFPLELGEMYETFVRDIYAQDEIADWKVNKKIETMFKCSDERNVNILIMDIKTDVKRYHEFKKRSVYVNLENMKIELRNKYSKLVKEYFFDNVFHVTDDEKEYIADLNVVNKYIELGLKENASLEKGNYKVLTKGLRINEFKK